jgi:hypothetical protein
VGYEAQQTDEPRRRNQPDNLFAPVPGDHGTHGPFDDRAREFSWQLWANMRRWQMVAGVAGAAAVMFGMALNFSRQQHESR